MSLKHNDWVQINAMLEDLSPDELEAVKAELYRQAGAVKGIEFRMNERHGQRVRHHPAVIRSEMVRLGYCEEADFK